MIRHAVAAKVREWRQKSKDSKVYVELTIDVNKVPSKLFHIVEGPVVIESQLECLHLFYSGTSSSITGI